MTPVKRNEPASAEPNSGCKSAQQAQGKVAQASPMHASMPATPKSPVARAAGAKRVFSLSGARHSAVAPDAVSEAATVAANAVPAPAQSAKQTSDAAQPGQATPAAPAAAASAATAQSPPAAAASAAPRTAYGQIGATPAAPRVSEDRGAHAATALLKLEAEMRRTRGLAELAYFIANETRPLTRAQQVVVLERGRGGAMTVRAVSSITRLDRSSPLLLWFESVVAALEAGHGLKQAREFDAAAFSGSLNDVRDAYPMRHLVWIPFSDFDGEPIGGMLQARSTPWTEGDVTVSRHLASGFAHTWMAMGKARSRLSLPGRIGPRNAALTALALALACLFPVSMSALAPVEVAPRDSFIVTSGVEGVVDQVLVEPNAAIKKGQPLVQLADTILKNKLEIASREVVVAETKFKKAAQLAFVDMRGRHEMAQAKAELELRTAERDYARDLFARATVKAERDGIAFFGDKKDLIGRPVAVGEKLMEIADAQSSEFHVDLGVADAIVLHEGARLKVFLDSDPLHPIAAKLVRADYQARAHDNQQLAFRLVAEAAAPPAQPPRLGVRGTAQVYSDTVPLVFYLLRRPIAAVRQWVGL